MPDSISSIADLADRATLVNLQDTVDATEHNTTRTATQNAVNLLHDIVQEQDNNYSGTTAPTLKSQGKVFNNTNNTPSTMEFYNDGAATSEVITSNTATATLTNKTYTNPTFSPAGAKGYLSLGRDLNLKIINNATNPTYQIDVSFEYLTLYSDAGLACVESQTTAAVYDLATGLDSGGERAEDATAEGSASEQANKWYYVFIYSNGAGTLGAVLSTNDDWSDIAAGDKPSGSTYYRRVGVIRNDNSSDLLLFHQINDLVGIENGPGSAFNIGSVTSTLTWLSVDISSLVPKKIIGISGWFYKTTSGYGWISPVIRWHLPRAIFSLVDLALGLQGVQMFSLIFAK